MVAIWITIATGLAAFLVGIGFACWLGVVGHADLETDLWAAEQKALRLEAEASQRGDWS